MKTIVTGVLYRGVESFLQDYFESIAGQSTKEFQLYLFNNHQDSSFNLERWTSFISGIHLTVIDIPGRPVPPPTLRQYMVDILRTQRADFLIFTDTDDYFDQKRFEMTIKALRENDIVFNDLTPFDSETKQRKLSIFSQRPISTITFKDILDYNLLGYSHTGIKARCLDRALPLPMDAASKVTDWFFFGGLLSQGLRATFVPGTTTYYRQYAENTAGIVETFDEQKIRSGVKVKKSYYQYLLPNLDLKSALSISTRLQKIKQLEKELSDPEKMRKYLKQVNAKVQQQKMYWWEQIDFSFLDDVP
ncbi:glycosyltransferase family 2 protein [Candidatus Woesearchaeota archaeon]|nr:glycosyltransferase family 2 protein [Candidatus Woesearchaeota archaeon]